MLYPDTETPFADVQDAINRLLPYHVFQIPEEDLEYTGKGKGKASELQRDIQETKFALECFRRRQALEERFRNARVRAGRRTAPADQDYLLAQIVLDSERGETAGLNAELRAARAELERLKDKKGSAQPSRPQPYYSSTQPYYRYTYGQPYVLSTTGIQPASVSSMTPAPAVAGGYTPQVMATAIPVQLPVASLPALHALGIVPVPVPTGSTDGTPNTHAAILRGSSADGSMLNLEINVSLLQSTQMNGLATVLNTLLTKNPPASSSSSSPNSSTPATPIAKEPQ